MEIPNLETATAQELLAFYNAHSGRPPIVRFRSLAEAKSRCAKLKDPVERIARVAHEVNRAYCEALGDSSQLAWENAPQLQRDSAMHSVKMHMENPDAGPQAGHESWMAQKIADGWVYGPEKLSDMKSHPCIVPFNELPLEQKAKDYLFRGVVLALRGDKR